MSIGARIWAVETHWLRRVLLLAYVLPGVLYNIVWHYPKLAVSEGCGFVRYGWTRDGN